MDTPERTQLSIPISDFEESPFSNFVNSLSPIKPIKAINISQTFSSLSFSSPPSIFTSPHASIQKESRFLRRHQFSDLTKPQFASNDAVHPQNSPPNQQQVQGEGLSSAEVSLEPLCEDSELAIELPMEFKYKSDCKTDLPSVSETNCEPDTSALVPSIDEPFRRGSFKTELNYEKMEEIKEGTSCDWEILISDALVFGSPNNAAALKKPLQRPMDAESSFFASLLTASPPDDANFHLISHHVGSTSSDDWDETKDQFTLSAENNGKKKINQAQDNWPSASMDDCFTSHSDVKWENENLSRSMRRRCLFFEIPGSKKSVDGGLISASSNASLNEGKVAINKKLLPCKLRGDSSGCIFSGIGLHLNALAAASKSCQALQKETVSSDEPLTVSPTTSCESPIKSSCPTSLEKAMGPTENAIQGAEDSPPASTYVAGDELAQNTPKKKRRRLENSGEGDACKRCNCKKSKCLKLYCECFAAGVYCVEQCSCQDCLNKPIHEDTVLTTRKQIESRNPLAFAPKVIRSSDSVLDLEDESTRTPASARHKRGCNCKKSSCLKKYCECYQGGVGCSVSCRCEGCKNAFGRKDGSTMLGIEAEIEEETRACEEISVGTGFDQPGIQSEEPNSEFVVPKTPLRLFRTSALLPMSSKVKPPRSSFSAGSSSSGSCPSNGQLRSTFLRSQPKTEKQIQTVLGDEIEMPAVLQASSSPSSGIKTVSPNSKRVSPPQDNGRSPGLRSRKLILQSIPSFPSLTPRR
ncbi:hypothetical protein Nepgr_031091 [Nepenthes gracilis]|uniref:CRC domain-containing protein n=1 Tax=Nepenthes gracilis TaxID=150966 RepID=A0AAD3Y4U6_NEPGR|nr:hypothetical protein Nepgr_031091 [Nepenthes gracilis]